MSDEPEARYTFKEFVNDQECAAAELIGEAERVTPKRLCIFDCPLVNQVWVTHEFVACEWEDSGYLRESGFWQVSIDHTHIAGGYVFFSAESDYVKRFTMIMGY